MTQPKPIAHLVCGSTGAGKTTYALQFCQENGALHLSIDAWMMRLFAADMPTPLSPAWIFERVGRCEAQVVALALQAGQVGIRSVLDVGLQSLTQRRRIVGQLRAAGLEPRLHFIDVPVDVRWSRVVKRNATKSGTFQMTVTREMFDYIERMWEPPSAAELADLDGIRVEVGTDQ